VLHASVDEQGGRAGVLFTMRDGSRITLRSEHLESAHAWRLLRYFTLHRSVVVNR
jgi:hypothetical protein